MRYLHFDRWGNPLDDLPYVTRALRTRNLDATDTLDITIIGETSKDDRIVIHDSMGRWAEYLVQSVDTQRATGLPVTTAYCVGSIAELSRTYIQDRRNRDADARSCLAKALEDTRWTVGTVELGTTTTQTDLSFYHCSVLDAIDAIADTFGLEIETEYRPDDTACGIGQRIVHLLEHRGSTTAAKRFEYGRDLTQIKRSIDPGDVITRLYGWGKGVESVDETGEATGGYGRKLSFADINNGKAYVEDTAALANWGVPGPDGTRRHAEGAVDFPDCEDPAELMRLTRAELATRTTPIVSYEADVVALAQAGVSADGTDLGDEVQIVDATFPTPLRLQGRILQIEEDLAGSLADTRITLGNIRETLTQRMNAQTAALDKLVSNSGAWDSAAAGSGPYMRDLIDRVNQVMNATGGYTYLKPGEGIWVYDKPEDQNPTQCIQIGGGYWRIAHSRKANGDWDFRSLADGHGIFADTLYTGKLSDAAGLNHWDLDTGDFSLSARASLGGKTVTQHVADTLESAKAYVEALDESLGQKSIFDRLTDNGATQGIYLDGGLLYINATYIKTGVLDAGLIKAGVLTDKTGNNTWDLDKGELTTQGMTAKKITATGIFTCGTGNSTVTLGNDGRIVGKKSDDTIGWIDYNGTFATSASTGGLTYNSGLVLQSSKNLAIYAPNLYVSTGTTPYAATNPDRAYKTYTGTITQTVITAVTTSSGSVANVKSGAFVLTVRNGMIIGSSTVSA